jgi:glycine/D-amino acid oxidase-like deaminating enzyme
VVIGGGVCGAVCAAEAARRGASVVVVEKELDLAREASGRSFGSLRVQGRHPAEVPLAVEAIELWAEAARSLAPFDFVQGGNLYVAETDAEMAELQPAFEEAKAAGLADVRLVGPSELREIVPCLEGRVAGGLLSPRDGHCDPRKAVQAYAGQASGLGARIALATRALQIATAGGRVTGVRTDRGDVAARRVVVAAGVWTARMVRPLGIRVPVRTIVYSNAETSPLPPLFAATIRGFRFSCRQRPGGELVMGAGLDTTVAYEPGLDDLRDARLWLPRYWANRRRIELRFRPARMLQGAWRDAWSAGRSPGARIPVGQEPLANPRLLERARTALAERLPLVRTASLARAWAGLIDLSPDGLPVIERVRRPDGLVLLTGLSGHGLALAPVLGRTVAQLALDDRTDHDLTPFRLARFDGPVPAPHRLV